MRCRVVDSVGLATIPSQHSWIIDALVDPRLARLPVGVYPSSNGRGIDPYNVRTSHTRSYTEYRHPHGQVWQSLAIPFAK